MGHRLVMEVSVRTRLLIIRFSFSNYVSLLAEIMAQNPIMWANPLVVTLFWKVMFFKSYGEESWGWGEKVVEYSEQNRCKLERKLEQGELARTPVGSRVLKQGR